MKEYLVILEKAPANWAAYSPDVPGCVSTGETQEETLANFEEALRGHLALLAEFGEPLPEPSSQARRVAVAAAA